MKKFLLTIALILLAGQAWAGMPITTATTVDIDADNNGMVDVARGGTNATTAEGARAILGLGKVNNTADMDKPVSLATQSALNCKQDLVLPISSESDLREALTVGGNIVLSRPITLTDNLVIPSTVTLEIKNGGIITVPEGKTLTINSPFSPGAYQVFTGSGTVAGLKEARPEWFGAKGDGVTDDRTALQSASTAVTGSKISGLGSGAKVLRLTGNYYTSDYVSVGVGVTVLGDGPAATSIISAAGKVALDLSGGTDQAVKGVSIYSGGGAGSMCIKADTVTRPIIDGVFLVGAEYGIKGSKSLYPVVKNAYISSTAKGISLESAGGTWNSGWYNNLVTLSDVRTAGDSVTTTGIDIVGMGVLMTNCDTSHNLVGTKISGTTTASVNKSQTSTIVNQYNEDTDKPFVFVNCRRVTIISAYSQGKATGSAASSIYDLTESEVYVVSNTLLDYFEYVAVCANNSRIDWPQSFTSYVDTSFSSVDGTSAATVLMNGTIINNTLTYRDIPLSSSTNTITSHADAFDNGSTSVIFEGRQANGTVRHRWVVGGASSWNAADAAYYVAKDGTSGRSINAAGTVNASGTDYAEYEYNNGVNINCGEIVGFKSDGTLTLIFSEAMRFAVKSTDPAFVGGDTWGVNKTKEELTEEERFFDKIAYTGKVPVNVYSATPGDYVIAVSGNGGGIKGVLVKSPTFEQYKNAVGRVNRVLHDGRAEIAVIIH